MLTVDTHFEFPLQHCAFPLVMRRPPEKSRRSQLLPRPTLPLKIRHLRMSTPASVAETSRKTGYPRPFG